MWTVSEALDHTLVREFQVLFWSEEYEIMEVTFICIGDRAESQRDLLRESREREMKDVHVLFLSSLSVPVLPTQA